MTTAYSRLDVATSGASDQATQAITLQVVYDELGFTVGDDTTRDDRVTRKIERVTARVVEFLDQGPLTFQRYVERVPGFADDILQVNRTPIVGVISVEFIPTSGAIEVPLVAGVDITDEIEVMDQNDGPGSIRRRFGNQWSPMIEFSLHKVLTEWGNPVPGTEDPNFRVTYEAGFLFPGQTTPAPTGGLPLPQTGDPLIPLPLFFEEALLAEVIFTELNRLTGGVSGGALGLRSEQVDQTKLEFFSLKDLTPSSGQARKFGFRTQEAYDALAPHRRLK